MIEAPDKAKYKQKYNCNKTNYSQYCQAPKAFNLKTIHVFKLKKAEQRSPTLEDYLGDQIYIFPMSIANFTNKTPIKILKPIRAGMTIKDIITFPFQLKASHTVRSVF